MDNPWTMLLHVHTHFCSQGVAQHRHCVPVAEAARHPDDLVQRGLPLPTPHRARLRAKARAVDLVLQRVAAGAHRLQVVEAVALCGPLRVLSAHSGRPQMAHGAHWGRRLQRLRRRGAAAAMGHYFCILAWFTRSKRLLSSERQKSKLSPAG